MKRGVIVFLAAVLCLLLSRDGYSREITRKIVIADFNTGGVALNTGESFGVWDKDPKDNTQGCYMGFIDEGSNGKYLKIKYDVDSPNPAYNGIWFSFKELDVSSFGKLVFKVKGDLAAFKIEIKNNDEVGYYFVSSVEDRWSKIIIPLENFKNISDFTKLTELVFVFDDMNAVQKVGSFCLDDIWFEESIVKKVQYKEKVAAAVNLSGADLKGANLEKAVLNKVNFYRVNLSNATLVKAKLIGADLIGAILNWANLTEANLSESNLYRATLTRATLVRTILEGADLRFALFSGANLTEANLTGADLTGTNFKNANLTGVSFGEANVVAANFYGVIGLDSEQKKYLQKGRAKNVPE